MRSQISVECKLPQNASAWIGVMRIASRWCQNSFTLCWPCWITPSFWSTVQLQRRQFHVRHSTTLFPKFLCSRCINLKSNNEKRNCQLLIYNGMNRVYFKISVRNVHLDLVIKIRSFWIHLHLTRMEVKI